MFHSFKRWFANRPPGAPKKGSRPRKRARWPRLQLEFLEDRLTPSTISATDAPQLIPIGNPKAGQTIQLEVDFSTTDAEGDFAGQEQEPIIISGSDGSSQTVSDYGSQTIDYPITLDGETLTAYIQDYDSDETGIITFVPPTAEIQINGSTDPSDHITLFNPPGSAEPFAQPIPATITNTGDSDATFDLSVEGNTGAVTLSQTTIDLAAGESNKILITPTADSAAPNDVQIVVSYNGDQVDEDDMTVVGVTFPQNIYNDDTPSEMLDLGAYRIPPRVDTPVNVEVTPAFLGDGQSVTLSVTGQDANNGIVNIDGNATEDITSTGNVNLSGVSQTSPGSGGNLQLMLKVRGQTTIQSNGFSVAAIPLNYSDTLASPPLDRVAAVIDPTTGQPVSAVGIRVQDGWQSDSGNIADLDQVALSEQVDYPVQTGIFASEVGSNSSYQGPATSFTKAIDTHAFQLSLITSVNYQGTLVANQVTEFSDERTGVTGIPVTDSGYVITKTVDGVPTETGLVVMATTTKAGASTTAQGISSDAGATPGVAEISVTQLCGVFGDPLVVTTQPPASTAAGAPFGLVVTAENSDGTTNTSFNGSVTLALSGGFGATLHGTATVTAVNGVATFSGLTVDRAGLYSFSVSAAGLPTVTTNSFDVTGAAATKLAVLGPFGSIITGSPFSLQVDAEDPFGNVDPNFNGSVTLGLSANPVGGTLGGTLTATAVNGVATFSGLTLNRPGTGYVLQATGTGLTAGKSFPFAVTNQLVVTAQPPSSITAGTSFGLTVKAEDGSGAVDTSFSGSVTVSLAGFFGGPNPLSGTLTVAAVNGVATFSGLTLDRPGSYSLLVNSTGLAGAMTNSFTVSAGAATQLVVTAQPPSVTAGAGFGLTVTAEDPFGNVDPSFAGSVALALASNPGGATLGGALTATAAGGVATFSGLTLNSLGTGYTLKATSTGLAAATTNAFDVRAPGVATQLVVTTQPPASTTAGTAFGLVVTAEDGSGTVDTSFSGPVTLALADNVSGGTLGGTVSVTAVHGVATFSGLTVDQAGSYALAASSNGLAGTTTGSFGVTPAAATHLVVQGPFGHLLSGKSFNLTVNADDPFGNVDPNFSGGVTLALGTNPGSSTLGGTLTVTASGGVASFHGLTLNNPGSGYTLLASSPGLTAGTSSPFNVTNDQLVITTPPPSSITAGSSFGLVVSVENGQGNVDTSFNGSVTVAPVSFCGPGATLGGTLTVTAVNGVASFSGLTLNRAGSYALSVTSNGLPATSTNPFDVTATQLVVTAQPPAILTAGAGFGVTVTAEDPSGNVDPTFSGGVTLALASNPGGATLGGMLTATAVHGVATFSGLTLDNPGTGFTLKATSTGLTAATTNAIQVAPAGVATRLVVTSQPPASIVAGTGFGLTVKAEDTSGTVQSSFNGRVTLALNNYSAAPTSQLGGTPTVTASNGVATFSGLTLTQAGAYSLSVTGTGLVGATTGVVNVTAAGASQLAVVGPGGNVLAGAPFNLQVNAEDPHGNVDPTFNGGVTLALANNPGVSTLGGTLTATAVHGVASFTGLTINQPGSGYTLRATTTAGLSAGTSAPVNVTNDRLVVTTPPPGSVAAGSGFGLVVKAEDGSGNVDASFNGSVTVARRAAGPLGGTLTVTASGGVATFSGLTLDVPGTYKLSLTASGLAPATTGFLNVTAAATKLVVTTPPPGAITAGAGFRVDVTAEDSLGNPDPTFTGSVTLALANNPGGATLGGTLTATAIGGVASFPGLTLNLSGTGYTLQATGTGLAAATTGTINVTAPGVATQLVVTSQPPASVVAGTGFGLTVKAEDSFGTVDTAFNGSVTVAPPAGGKLGGTLTVTAAGGVATFSGLTLDQAGDSSLSVSSSGLPATTTDFFTVTAAPATRLVVLNPFSSVTPGSSFALEVLAVDGNGNIDTTFNGSVTLALANNPGAGTLGGTLTATAVQGVASFSGLTLDAPGLGYTLKATTNGLAAGTSAPFNVVSPATRLVVTTQPASSVAAGAGFGLVVSAEDGSGRVDPTFTGSVTLALASNPGGATLGGTLTVAAVNGVATFSGLTLDKASNGYVIQTSAGGLTEATTNPINVTANVTVVVLPPLTGDVTSLNDRARFSCTAGSGQG
jgi:hypothetical protein